MSASDENKSDARAQPATDADINAAKVMDHEPAPSFKGGSIKRKIRLYGALLAVLFIAILVAAGAYPYWRADAASVLSRVNVNLESLETRLNIPYWAITHGRRSAAVKGETETTAKESPGPTNKEVASPTNKVETTSDSPTTPTLDPVRPAAQIASTATSSIASLREITTMLEEKLSLTGQKLAGIEDRLAAVEQSLNAARAASSEVAVAPTASPPEDLSEQLEMISRRLLAVEARQGEIADAGAGRTLQTPAPDSALIGTVVGLAERVAAMEARATVDPSALADLVDGSRALESTVAGLHDQLEKFGLELKEETPVRDRAALLLLSISQLAVVTSGPRPYEAQLDALQVVMDGQPGLADSMNKLASHAVTGAPTLAGLRIEFAAASNAAIRSRDVGPADGLLGKTLSRVASLVTVRKIDDIEAGTVDGALAAADAALGSGDIEAAVKVLEALGGAPGEAVAPWVSRARVRLDVDTAISDLRAAALGALAAAG
jgi:hypothetical protein